MRRGKTFLIVAAASILVVGTAMAAPRRMSPRGSSTEEQGFFIFLDSAMMTPLNADEVVAIPHTVGTTLQTTGAPIQPDWGTNGAARVGFGYQWENGSKLTVTYWKFDHDKRIVADGPSGGGLDLTIGPPVFDNFYLGTYYSPTYVGAYAAPGHVDFVAKLKAETFDVTWGKSAHATDNFSMEWQLGVRYARFDEKIDGFYTTTPVDPYTVYGFRADKSNEGKMLGVLASARATYRFSERFSLSSGLAFSELSGKVTSSSGLTPLGGLEGLEPPTRASVEDKHRSGSIRDLDVTGIVHFARGRFDLSFGWEQSAWDDIPADLVRNNAGSFEVLAPRNNVAFSGFKIGLLFRF